MYLKSQRPIDPKFSLCQLPTKANSKYKTEDLHCVKSVQIQCFSGPNFPVFGLNMEYLDTFHTVLVYWRSVLRSKLAALLLHIIRDSNVSLIRGLFRNPATFKMKYLVRKDIGFQKLTIVWKSYIIDLVGLWC